MFAQICNVSLILLLLINNPVGYAFASDQSVAKSNISSIKSLSDKDYSLMIKGEVFSLGDKWTEAKKNKAGNELSNNYVGEVEINSTSYRFYQHDYDGYVIYSSNIYYDKEKRDIDEYIVSQISLKSRSMLTTYRGVKIGDPLSLLIKKYGPGQEDNSEGEKWIDYQSGNKILSFQIEADKIINIMMAISTGER